MMAKDPLQDADLFRMELSKERLQNAELALRLKEQERNHTHEVNSMKSLLEAEQDKTMKFRQLLSERHSANRASLETQLQEALDTNQQLTAELAKLRRYAAYEGLEQRLEEQQSKTYSMTERVKELEGEVEVVRQEAVRTRQSAEIRDKEKQIVVLMTEVAELQELTNEQSTEGQVHEATLRRGTTKEIRLNTEELELQVDKITLEKWQLVEDIQDLKANYERDLHSLMEQSKEETEGLKQKAARLEQELKETVDELNEEKDKAASERERRRQLVEELHTKEDAVEKLKEELDTLGKSLVFGQQRIERLEHEINREADDEYDYNERVKELTRLNSKLTSQVRDFQTQVQTHEAERSKLETSLLTAQREVKRLQLDKKDQTARVVRLQEELEETKEELRLRDERLVGIKEEFQEKMTSRVLELRQEKMVLEQRIEELLESSDIARRSIDLSMHDELSCLDSSGHFNTPRGNRSSRFSVDNKQADLLRVEVGERDYLIKSLRAEKELLEKKVEEMHTQVYQAKSLETRLKSELQQKEDSLLAELKKIKSKHRLLTEELENEIDELRSDIDKFQKQAIRSAEHWAEENNQMRTDLSIAEHTAITAKLQYAQAATDLEILLKKLSDKGKKRRFSFFKKSRET